MTRVVVRVSSRRVGDVEVEVEADDWTTDDDERAIRRIGELIDDATAKISRAYQIPPRS